MKRKRKLEKAHKKNKIKILKEEEWKKDCLGLTQKAF